MKLTREQICIIVVVLAIVVVCYFKPRYEAFKDKERIIEKSEELSTRLVWLPDADMVFKGEGQGPLKTRMLENITVRGELREMLKIEDSDVIEIGFRPLEDDRGMVYYVDKGTDAGMGFKDYIIEPTEESIGLYFMVNNLNLPYTTEIQMDNTLLKFIPIA